MANVLNGNTYYVDTASSTGTNILDFQDVTVLAVVFTSGTAGANFVLNDIAAGGSVGSAKLKGSIVTANDTLFLRLADSPIRFPSGIYVSILSSGTLSLVVKQKG